MLAQAECHLWPRQGMTRDSGTQAGLHTGQALHAALLIMHMHNAGVRATGQEGAAARGVPPGLCGL
jgi:hypothetical protein